MASKLTVPVTARLRPGDREALAVLADHRGTTVSALICRIVQDKVSHEAPVGHDVN